MLRLTLTLVLALAVTGTALAAAAGPTAKAARGCNISGKERKLGATYVTSLRVRNLSCSDGASLVKAYHSCRRKGNGRSCSGFSGYKCTQKVIDKSKTQYDAKAECSKGSKVFSQVYTQNT